MDKDKSPEQILIDAIVRFLATKVSVPNDIADGFRLKDGYPRINFEHGVFNQIISIEVELERPSR